MKHNQPMSPVYIRSMLLGLPFVCAWLGFTAIMAKDGRQPVTDWLDPFLASVTLLSILFVQLVFIVVWPYIHSTRVRLALASLLAVAQWAYIFGEILSNTITIGEPPEDIGSLFEIAAGVVVFICSIAIILYYMKHKHQDSAKRKGAGIFLLIIASLLFAGMIWWFTHPIDQSEPGAPAYIPGNPVYNFFRGSSGGVE